MSNANECEKEIADFCDSLKNRLLDKFKRGREVHGDDLSSLDINNEMSQEVLDIINYHCIFKAQKKSPKNSNEYLINMEFGKMINELLSYSEHIFEDEVDFNEIKKNILILSESIFKKVNKYE